MKEKIITLLFLSFAMVSFAQTDDFNCKFVANIQNQCDGQFSARIDEERFDDFEPVVVNIYFWELKMNGGFVDDEDYNYNWDFEKEALDVIAGLNILFNPYKIYFKYNGISSINHTTLYNIDDKNELLTYLDNSVPSGIETKKIDAFNVYVAPKIGGGASTPFRPRYLLSREGFDTGLVDSYHEVGHTFGLLHPHNYWFNCYDPNDPDPLPNAFLAENVTRQELIGGVPNPDYNADTNGDRVPDTAAAPDYKYERCKELGYDPPYTNCPEANWNYYIVNCTYDNPNSSIEENPFGKDCNGVPYEIFDEDVSNIMSYAPKQCKEGFTIGQGIRMRESFTTTCAGLLNEAVRSDGVASLYEPYKGEYYLNGTVPVDENGNLNPPLYQPGFDYNFIDCDCLEDEDCDLPLDYGNTNFTYNEQIGTFIHKEETDYSSITHPNHTAIRIIELEESQPWRCYDNYNRRPSGGTIIKFNDNVLNTNVTITAQDSTAINDENLINNLQPGLYNIIEQYEDGDTDEKVIFKENN